MIMLITLLMELMIFLLQLLLNLEVEELMHIRGVSKEVRQF